MTDGLLVDRKELLEALTIIRRHSKSRGKTQAYLYRQLGELKIQAGNTRVSLKCRGEWPFSVSVNAVMLGRVSLDLPKVDPVLIQAVLDRLYIGTLSLDSKKVSHIPSFTNPTGRPQKSQTTSSSGESSDVTRESSPKMRDGLSLPANASSRHLLKARLKYTDEELTFAGLTTRIEKALMERNRRITKALEQLSEYGLTHADLVKLVDVCLKRNETTVQPKRAEDISSDQ